MHTKAALLYPLHRLFFITLCIFLCACATYAQQFGAFPSNTKWKQINTDTARIIYAPSVEAQAQQVASLVHRMAQRDTSANRPEKINIVLHNRTTLANGYVGLAPYRSEFYLVPGGNPFDFGNLPWHEQLAIHEYRHVQQFNAFNRGLTKVFGVVLGEEGRALANGLAVPDWYFEGDAVHAETVLTSQGRGRMPYFLKDFQVLWKEGRHYNWMKLRNGSLKDFVPSHYPLGYLLVNYGYHRYGTDFWSKVTADASAFKSLIYPFQKAVERHAGRPFKTFRSEALKWYSHELSRKRDDQKTRETVTNYYYPQVIGKDSLLYMKEGYKDIPRFYIRDSGGEHRLKLRNITNEDWFSYRDGLVAYTSYYTSARWGLVNYSDITLLDTRSGKEERVTKGKRYFTPDLSPGGDRIIAVSFNDSLGSVLHLLDRHGTIIQITPAPEDAIFVQPRFIDTRSIAVGIRHPDATISWNRYGFQTGNWEVLIAPTKATIGFPYVAKGKLYFTASAAGTDDLYRLDLAAKSIEQLTVGGTGNYFPSVDGDTLHFSTFTSNGYRLQKKTLSGSLNFQAVSPAAFSQSVPYPVAGDSAAVSPVSVPKRNFSTASYKKGTGLLNVHSWRPFYEAPEYRFSVYSNNVLNTLSNELFYRYNENERAHALGFNSSYGGLFPVINGGAEYTFQRHIRSRSQVITISQWEARAGYSIPLTLTSGNTYKFLNFGSNLVWSAYKPTGASKDSIRGDATTYLHHFISWSHQLPKARAQIFPKLAYAVNASYRHRTDAGGYQSLGHGQIFLPGLTATHSLQLGGSFQQTDTSNVLFSNRFVTARGYEDLYFSRMWRGSANYHFPLLYPDRGVANIVYLLRLRANAFYDVARVFSKDKKLAQDLRSVGTEIFFDTRWWNQLPVSFGVRYSRLLDGDKVGQSNPNRFEFVLPVNLIPN